MLFTSQHLNSGQQASMACSTTRFDFSMYEKNWLPAFLCSDPVGTPSAQCSLPGNGEKKTLSESKSAVGMPTQNLFFMKNARKQLGEIASKDATQINPGPIVSDNPDSLPLFENPIFHEKPRPRQPESPEAESFRSWLKTSAPRHKASPALLERIKMITLDDKV